MNNNYYYFKGCQNKKLQWLSIYLQCQLLGYEGVEIERKQLFVLANMAWYDINRNDPLIYTDFEMVLEKIIRYKMVFNLKVSPSKQLFLAVKNFLLKPAS